MAKFGWCSDGHHGECPTSFVDWNNKEQACSCNCHKDSK